MRNINEIMELILKEAEQKRENAGYNGDYGDGGASQLEDQVKFFKLGWGQQFPPEWEKYKIQFNRENDPEYQKYLLLKDKFKD